MFWDYSDENIDKNEEKEQENILYNERRIKQKKKEAISVSNKNDFKIKVGNNTSSTTLATQLIQKYQVLGSDLLSKYKNLDYDEFDCKINLEFYYNETDRDFKTDNICTYGIHYCLFKASKLDGNEKEYYITKANELCKYAEMAEYAYDGFHEDTSSKQGEIGFKQYLEALRVKYPYPYGDAMYKKEVRRTIEYIIDNDMDLSSINYYSNPINKAIQYEKKNNSLDEQYSLKFTKEKSNLSENWLTNKEGEKDEDMCNVFNTCVNFPENDVIIQKRDKTLEFIIPEGADSFKLIHMYQNEFNIEYKGVYTSVIDGREINGKYIFKIYSLDGNEGPNKKDCIKIIHDFSYRMEHSLIKLNNDKQLNDYPLEEELEPDKNNELIDEEEKEDDAPCLSILNKKYDLK